MSSENLNTTARRLSEEVGLSIKKLWEEGVHFGHVRTRWNPKMSPYIYGIKNNVHIIDLRQTFYLLNIAQEILYKTAKRNGRILFVGTRPQAAKIVEDCAKACGQYYVTTRWLGGTLTNWPTVSRSIRTLEELERVIETNNEKQIYTKKEILDKTRHRDKLLSYLGGIRDMGGKPDLVVLFDTNKDHLAVKEAKILGIDTIAILDTNSEPDGITYPIPGNDDSMKALELYSKVFSSAVLLGMQDGLNESGENAAKYASSGDGALDRSVKFRDKGAVSRIKNDKRFSDSKVKIDDADKTFEEQLSEF